MTAIISTKEFRTNQKKYFDLAVNGNVCIKRGENMFYLSRAPMELQYSEQPICKDNSDLDTAITGDELRRRLHQRIHAKFIKRV